MSDRRGEGIAGVVGDLLASGGPVLVVCADVGRRRAALEQLVAGLAPVRQSGRERAELPVASWDDLSDRPELAGAYAHIVALDPPAAREALDAVRLAPGQESTSFLHLAWGPEEVDFALAVARAELDPRAALIDVYRALRSAGAAEGDELAELLRGRVGQPRGAVRCARLLRILQELELVAYERGPDARRACRAVESSGTALDRSRTYRESRRRLEECERYLSAEAARWPGRRSAQAGATAAGV